MNNETKAKSQVITNSEKLRLKEEEKRLATHYQNCKLEEVTQREATNAQIGKLRACEKATRKAADMWAAAHQYAFDFPNSDIQGGKPPENP